MNDPVSHTEINLGASGAGTVVVNGKDVTDNVDGLQLIVESGKIPRLLLHGKASASVKVDGIVERFTPGTGILEFLEVVNPTELEGAALDKVGVPVPEAFLEALREIATEWLSST